MKHRSSFLTVAASTLAALSITQSVHAANILWGTGTVGDWETTSSWADNALPVTADQAHITNGGSATLSSSVTINALQIGNTDGLTSGQLTINNGGSLTVSNTSTLRAGSTLTLNNGGSFSSTSIFNVGSSAGSGSLVINSGGTLSTTNSGSASYLRLGVSGGTGSVTVNGGQLNTRQVLSLGFANNATATLTVKNGGHYQGLNGRIFFGANSETTTTYTGVTSTLNVGGETTAEAAGTFAGVANLRGFGVSNTNIVNFNHTSARHHFLNTGNGTALVIQDEIKVQHKAGVTVLDGANTYTRGTDLTGGVLLANYTGSAAGSSSTGTGAVTVGSAATLGGIGNVGGITTVEGILKPGDYDYGSTVASYETLTLLDDVTLTDTATFVLGINGTTRGTDYSAINVDGSVALDGTLQVDLLNDFTIGYGETHTFEIIRLLGSDDITGAFDQLLLADSHLGINLTWDTSALNTGWISVTAEAIPEPSTYALIGAAGLLLALRRRRANSAA